MFINCFWKQIPSLFRHGTKHSIKNNLKKTSKCLYSTSLKKAMEEDCIVPDVIACAPEECLTISYDSGVKVSQGNTLTPTQVKNRPVVDWNAECDGLYTLCLTDPDAPSRKTPSFREWHHWLVGNIRGRDVCCGDVLSAYIGSAPPRDTGLHRYVFLLYKQQCKLKFDERRLSDTSGEGRCCFRIKSFAEKYDLGTPLAGNYYKAEYDDYVPILIKKLGIETI